MRYVIKETPNTVIVGSINPGFPFITLNKKMYIKIAVDRGPAFCANCAIQGPDPDYILALNLADGRIETFHALSKVHPVKDYNLEANI